ncbi:hypothetical protein [Streptomyces physcomitrii]|uniref:hypothetical protein n=1 Tax=Streptomyces physcomitrii TaxID=2724184 RepID=UPI0028A8D7E7|nr:hypothetical protein [Streptomyces physcomitrii]
MTSRRWWALPISAALLLVSAGAAGATTGDSGSAESRTLSTRAAGEPSPLAALADAYRGVQGGNLCLLSQCTVGDSGPNSGPSNTQGFNLCLLALCTVRP